MKLIKPKFWSKRGNLISTLLFPFSLLVLLFIFFKKKTAKKIKFNIPIICLGNIYIGGTGKTPTSIFLSNELINLGRNPAILRKFYKSHIDEHELIKDKVNNLVLCKNRIDGIIDAEKANYDSIIMDDGFQDYQIEKDISIVCFNQKQLLGNELVLPSGPLRESLISLKDANIILINGDKDYDFEKKILKINKKLEIFYSKYKPKNINQFKNKKLLAIAGIANPDNFFDLLKKNNLNVKKELIFPDHYKFTKNEILDIVKKAENNGYQIVMSEKDYFKIKDFKIDKIAYLTVSLELNEKDKFIKTITKMYDKKN
jgi:tetraacyldisaccharide 4'-kinase